MNKLFLLFTLFLSSCGFVYYTYSTPKYNLTGDYKVTVSNKQTKLSCAGKYEVFESNIKIIVNELGMYDIMFDDFVFYNAQPIKNSFNVLAKRRSLEKSLQIILYDNFIEGVYFTEYLAGYTCCMEKYIIKGYRINNGVTP